MLRRLTARQREVLLLLEGGLTYAEVAKRLGVARGTALTHGRRGHLRLLERAPLDLGIEGALSLPANVRHHGLALAEHAATNKSGAGKHREHRGNERGSRHPHRGGNSIAGALDRRVRRSYLARQAKRWKAWGHRQDSLIVGA